MDHIIKIDNNYDLFYNDKYCGKYNHGKGIVLGLRKRVRCFTDKEPLKFPKFIMDSVIPFDHLAIATEKEALKFSCLHKMYSPSDENYYFIMRSECDYARIKKVNC